MSQPAWDDQWSWNGLTLSRRRGALYALVSWARIHEPKGWEWIVGRVSRTGYPTLGFGYEANLGKAVERALAEVERWTAKWAGLPEGSTLFANGEQDA